MSRSESLLHARLLEAANAVSAGTAHPGETKNLLREAAAKLVGYETFQEARTQAEEGGDPIWQYYDEKLWRSLLQWKKDALSYREALIRCAEAAGVDGESVEAARSGALVSPSIEDFAVHAVEELRDDCATERRGPGA